MQVAILFYFIFLCLYSAAQKPCAKYDIAMKNGYDYLTRKNFDKALVEFQAAQIAARECGRVTDKPRVELEKVFKGITAQRDEAEEAKKDAEKQRTLAERKTKEAIAQKEANQNQLARIYWNNSQAARTENNLLESLQFTAEALVACKDEDLRRNLLIDIENHLPNFSLQKKFHFADYDYLTIFSPDGKKIFSTSEDETGRIWDAATGKQIGEAMSFGSQVRTAMFSADSKKLLISGFDSASRLYNTGAGKQIGETMKHAGQINLAVFSPDETRILTAGSDSTARIWNASTAKLIQVIKHSGEVNSAVFNSNGTLILTASDDSTCRLWDALDGTRVGSHITHQGAIVSAVFSPDGKFIITAGRDSTARRWDAVTQKQRGAEVRHEDVINSVVVSRDGERVVTASSDGTAKLWNTSTGEVKIFRVENSSSTPSSRFNGNRVKRVVFNFDETRILGSTEVSVEKDFGYDDDTSFSLWNVATGDEIPIVDQNKKYVRRASFSADGKQLLTLESDGFAYVREVASGNLINPAMRQESAIESAVFNADGKMILTENYDSDVRLWYAEKEKKKNEFILLDGRVESVKTGVFSPDSKKILTTSFQTSAQLWDAGTGKVIGPSLQHDRQIISAVFSADSKYAVTTSFDSAARVWNTENGQLVGQPFKHSDRLTSALFEKNSRHIITATSGGKVYLGNLETGVLAEYSITNKTSSKASIVHDVDRKLLSTGTNFNYRVCELVMGKQMTDVIKENKWGGKVHFSLNGKQVAFVNSNNSVYLWGAGNLHGMGIEITHEKKINNVGFSPDGNYLLTASDDATARLWDCRTGRQVGPSMKHNGAVIATDFSPDGKRVATAGTDDVIRWWETATGKQIGVFPGRFTNGTSNKGDIVYSPDGKRILAIDMNGQRLWNVPGDLDIPSDLFKLQVQVSTGSQLNLQSTELEPIPAEAWLKLKDEYDKQAREHSKVCKYPEYNFWKRFYAE